MALSELQKSRLANAMKDIRDSPGWRHIRQLATAEAAEENPDWESLEYTLVELFTNEIRQEFANGIERQKGTANRRAYPGAAR